MRSSIGIPGCHCRPAYPKAGCSRAETGSQSRKTYSVKGDTVNLAARLAAHAESGTILMAADVLEHPAVLRRQ